MWKFFCNFVNKNMIFTDFQIAIKGIQKDSNEDLRSKSNDRSKANNCHTGMAGKSSNSRVASLTASYSL